MQESGGRQARRVGQRRNSRKQSAGPAALRYASDNFSAGERRHAVVAMIVFGLALVGICVAYAALAAGEILG